LNTSAADRASRDASLVLGLALPADTLLYLLLPLHHAAFGVTLGEAGLLLAANRLVRIAGYGWIARLYARRGPRLACVLAALGSAVAALGYASLSGVWALLLARLLWGLCFAALNIATQALPTAEPLGAARRSGRSRAIIAAGPMLGLLGGATLSQVAGPRPSFLVLAVTALFAVPFALRLPSGEEAGTGRAPARPRFSLPSRLDVWSFVQGLTLDGLFVLGLSVLAAAAMPDHAALAAGAALALRYAAEIVLGPVGGAFAERHGARQLLILLSVAAAGGLALVGIGLLWAGAVLVVLVRGLSSPCPRRSPRQPIPAQRGCRRSAGAGAGAAGDLARPGRGHRAAVGRAAAADPASIAALRHGCRAGRDLGHRCRGQACVRCASEQVRHIRIPRPSPSPSRSRFALRARSCTAACAPCYPRPLRSTLAKALNPQCPPNEP